MKCADEYAKGTIRLSTGKYTTIDEIETAVKLISAQVTSLTVAYLSVPPKNDMFV